LYVPLQRHGVPWRHERASIEPDAQGNRHTSTRYCTRRAAGMGTALHRIRGEIMKINRFIPGALALASLSTLAACVGSARGGVYADSGYAGGQYVDEPYDESSYYTDYAPPAPRETMIYQRPGYVWVTGRWARVGPRWQWRQGYWVRQRPGMMWTQPHWVRSGGRWLYRPGGWNRNAYGGRGMQARDRFLDRRDNRLDNRDRVLDRRDNRLDRRDERLDRRQDRLDDRVDRPRARERFEDRQQRRPRDLREQERDRQREKREERRRRKQQNDRENQD
jgi:hypothetical protein